MIKGRWFKFKNITISNAGEYILSGISNLETGSATKREITYIDNDGCEIRDIYYSKRMFEISGFIQALDEQTMVRLKRKLISACSLKENFRLKYFNRERTYSAECYFDKLPTFEVRKGWYLPFKLYITIPSFYWQSSQPYRVNLFGYEDKVRDTFTLPCVFTSIVNKVQINNNGDEATFPIFTIACENPTEGSRILIVNNTIGKKILLNYQTAENEVITINSFSQTAVSNLKGNITRYLSLDTEFFPLEKGVNDLESDSVGNIITLEYYENYLGV